MGGRIEKINTLHLTDLRKKIEAKIAQLGWKIKQMGDITAAEMIRHQHISESGFKRIDKRLDKLEKLVARLDKYVDRILTDMNKQHFEDTTGET